MEVGVDVLDTLVLPLVLLLFFTLACPVYLCTSLLQVAISELSPTALKNVLNPGFSIAETLAR